MDAKKKRFSSGVAPILLFLALSAGVAARSPASPIRLASAEASSADPVAAKIEYTQFQEPFENFRRGGLKRTGGFHELIVVQSMVQALNLNEL